MKKSVILLLTIAANLFGYTYYGQYEQDRYLYENIFHNKTNGVFVEFGALDGIRFSNTYFFEKYLGWTGICAEPNPLLFPQLQKNRNCICINGCITDFEGISKFFLIHGYGVGLSGLIEKYDANRVETLKKEIAPYNSKYEIIDVKCERLNNILRKNNIYHIDFLSIDTEGGELDILKSIDFDTFSIDVICVEVHHKDGQIRQFLENKGFVFLKTIGVDEIYQKNTTKRSPLIYLSVGNDVIIDEIVLSMH